MKKSCSPRRLVGLFVFSLALIGVFSFGTFNAGRKESAPSVATITLPPNLLLADGTETHGDGHGHGHDGGGQESHGGGGGGGHHG